MFKTPEKFPNAGGEHNQYQNSLRYLHFSDILTWRVLTGTSKRSGKPLCPTFKIQHLEKEVTISLMKNRNKNCRGCESSNTQFQRGLELSYPFTNSNKLYSQITKGLDSPKLCCWTLVVTDFSQIPLTEGILWEFDPKKQVIMGQLGDFYKEIFRQTVQYFSLLSGCSFKDIGTIRRQIDWPGCRPSWVQPIYEWVYSKLKGGYPTQILEAGERD